MTRAMTTAEDHAEPRAPDIAMPYVDRFCPWGHGELARREWSVMVQFVCAKCGFIRQLRRRDAPPRAEDVVATADHPTIGRARRD